MNICHISVFCFSLQLGMVQNLYQCWCGLRFFFARVYCICMRVLIAHVRFAEWVYLWEKLCERIRGLFPSFEQQLLKSSIIWTCYLCDLLPSDDSLVLPVTVLELLLMMHVTYAWRLWKKKLKPMIFVEGYFCPPTLFLIAVGFELVAMLAV